MASVTILPRFGQQTRYWAFARRGFADLPLCTALALLLLGYHPAAEDGGIYLAALASRLQPSLFPAEHGFAVAHTAHGLFLPLMVSLVGMLHLPLAAVVLLTYVAAAALTLAAARRVLKALCTQADVQRVALVVFAAAMGLPIAGTSLYLTDPYLTARSLSTPLLLFALAALLGGRSRLCALYTMAALLFHPMMTAWAALIFAMLIALRSTRPVRHTILVAGALCTAMAAIQWLGPVDGAALRAASLTRDYWFPGKWAWYEFVGLAAPPLLLLCLARLPPSAWFTLEARQLATATAHATSVTAVAACCLIHTSNSSLLLARLQPLRLLHFTYCVFLLLAGGWVASRQRQHQQHLRWLVPAAGAVALLLMQRQLYSHSATFELPGAVPVNRYQQAFVWIRDNTPANALFALDPDYTRSAGEDAHLFRAVALRSALPDAAKDGGIVSVVPALAADWAAAVSAQRGLAQQTDAERQRRLLPLGATWMVLPAESKTHLPCPYRNGSVQVCRLLLPATGAAPVAGRLPAPVNLSATQ